MDDPFPALPTALAARLSRRDALRTYVPPALAIVGTASLADFGTSGRVKVEEPKVEEPKSGGKKK